MEDESLPDDTSRRSHRLQSQRNPVKASDDASSATRSTRSSGPNSRADEDLDLSGYESNVSGPATAPHRGATIHLTADSCRMATSTMIDGVKLQGVCGVPSLECKRHLGARSKSLAGKQTRFEPGLYSRVANKGRFPHGKMGGYFRSEAVMADDRRDDRQRMAVIIDAHRDEASGVDEDEIQALKRKVGHHQEEALAYDLPPPPAYDFPPVPPMGYVPPPNAPSDDPSRLLQTFNPPGTPNTPVAASKPTIPETPTTASPPSEFYSMTTQEGHLVVIKGQYEALECLRKWNWTIQRLFASREEAETWQNTVRDATPPSPPPPASDASSVKKTARNKKRKGGSRKKKKASKKADPPSDSSCSSSSSSSSSNSDSESSDSDDSSSSSDSSLEERRSSKAKRKAKQRAKEKARAKAKKRKRHRRSRPKKKDRRNLTYGVDPSTKDAKKLFGFSISGEKIDKAIAPEDLSKKDREVLFEIALDTTSLPGMYLSKQLLDAGDLDDATNDRATLMASTMLTAGLGRKSNFRDAMWRQPRRHGLRTIKDRTTFFELGSAVNKSKEPAFNQQDTRLRSFLSSHDYDESEIDDYLLRGLLVRITRDTFDFYVDLISAAREAHLDFNAGGELQWEGGRGEALINHHSQKLLDIRTFAPDRRCLILQTYTYLRDAAKTSFETPAMSTAMWTQLAQVQTQLASLLAKPDTAKPGVKHQPAEGGVTESYKCSHCRCSVLHRALKTGAGRRHCPFSKKGFVEAKTLGKAAAEKLKADPTLSPKLVLEQVLAEHSP